MEIHLLVVGNEREASIGSEAVPVFPLRSPAPKGP